MLQNKRVPLFVSADPALGALDTNPSGNFFDVQYKNAIVIPSHSWDITVELVQAQIWWSARNVHGDENPLEKNNLFRLEVDGDAVYDVEIDPGLYNVSDLNSAVNNALINEGLTSGLVILSADRATGKILLTLTTANLQVEWVSMSFFALVGFNESQLVPNGGFTSGVFSELGPNIANFSDISSFLVHTNLVQGGIPLGDIENQTIANVQITVPPGGLINYQPNNPIRLNAPHLRGTVISENSFYVTDQLNRPVDFGGEFFSLMVLIRYQVDEQKNYHT